MKLKYLISTFPQKYHWQLMKVRKNKTWCRDGITYLGQNAFYDNLENIDGEFWDLLEAFENYEVIDHFPFLSLYSIVIKKSRGKK